MKIQQQVITGVEAIWGSPGPKTLAIWGPLRTYADKVKFPADSIATCNTAMDIC